MPPASRIGDMHTCPKVEPGPVPHVGGPILTGESTVLIGNMPAARVSDKAQCNAPPDSISKGASGVLISNQQAARIGDPTAHGGVIVAGFSTVLIGDMAQAGVMRDAARSGVPFCEECARARAAMQQRQEPQRPPSGGA
ncbi:MAG: PAAR domain-containing protein [Myxococcales bacterium]|nr:PAAR domain-containing protein [Myxococcales bacterium]